MFAINLFPLILNGETITLVQKFDAEINYRTEKASKGKRRVLLLLQTTLPRPTTSLSAHSVPLKTTGSF